VQAARSILAGVTPVKGPIPLVPGSSNADIERALSAMAEEGNQATPIAARLQSRPDLVARLLGWDHDTTKVATSGSAYNFEKRPFQFHRPRPFRLARDQERAAVREIERLETVCGAVEAAPTHDGDRALTPDAESWERAPLPLGDWPREKRVPVLGSRRERVLYDQRQEHEQQRRRSQGNAFRDFESGVFTVPKSDGGHRLCTDYRMLNEFQKKKPFKMDGVQTVADMIQQDDYGMMCDLKDCYLTMGLHPSQRKYCRFRTPGSLRRLQWKTVSFGMSEAPRICTKLLKPLIGLLKQIGLRCMIYIDDLLILDQDRDRLARGMAIAMDLLQGQVGLQFKTSKSCFRPSRVFRCLGLDWKTETMTVHAPASRLRDTQRIAKRLLKSANAGVLPVRGEEIKVLRPIPTKDLARFVGKATSMFRAVKGARRYLLFVQQALGHAVREAGWTGTTTLTWEAANAMRWWTTEAPWSRNGDDIAPDCRPIQGDVQTDAATETLGWGGTLRIGNGPLLKTRGNFSPEEIHLHINALELLGCWYTVMSLLPLALPRSKWHLLRLDCELDSIVAIKYAKVGVSRSLNLSRLGAKFFDWREETRVQMSFRHLRGIYNEEADRLSRVEWSELEWMLDRRLFQRILSAWNAEVSYDLFASRHNRQANSYFSWNHDFESLGTDSLSHQWSSLRGTLYAYPPNALISKVLQKVLLERVGDLILVVPLWPQQAWWPTLCSLLTEAPLLLPHAPWITTDPGLMPSWNHPWPLLACRLSGDLPAARACQRRLYQQCGPPPRTGTMRHMTRTLIASSGTWPRNSEVLVSSVLAAFQPGI
jgi:hypothetical protein